MMRTTQGLEQVHVIYRRVDDDFLVGKYLSRVLCLTNFRQKAN